ncbi:uncharacterized protein PFL1_00907 [Pseudozyma flocculosa PF-1]|uniref:F-box domain-containing protein n=1 Tax=Pseudozyma flocculosa TaxID=84751 RepID=A0A5C3F3T2_9BASI|nr:uncharacterized protein PFL1_00907 [Pseudozyma flocculosa PF-1]EPQ31574.1 hypothetical protein PFL1_00907 [Pseudozyma flocculosa PF-1]SPO38635.1 uncharacterized protein PSFLO_04114 [Pseudozyma flocculosa]
MDADVDMKAVEAGVDATVDQKPLISSSIQQLPTEILLEIWCCLDDYDLRYFGQVCKAFHAISKDPYFVAAYFLRNHFPHSIFRAIAFYKVFNVKVLEHLMNGGAPLSRNLVQELGRARFGGSHNPNYSYYNRNEVRTNWGTKIPLDSCLAVMKRGIKLFGKGITFTRAGSDEEKVGAFANQSIWTAWSAPSAPIREVFDKGWFVPLSSYRGQSTSAVHMAKIVARQPDLLPLALRNGWSVSTAEECDEAVRQMLMSGRLMPSSQVSTKIVEKFEQLHQHSNAYRVSVKVASEVINTLLDEKYWSGSEPRTDGFLQQAELPCGYEALMALERKGLLDFDLRAVVEATLRKTWKKSFSADLFKNLQQLATDFPGLGQVMATPLLLSLCGYVKTHGKPSSDVIAELACVDITTTTISNMLIATSISDVTFLFEVAEARLGDQADLAELVRAKLPQILCQPWRGDILTSLNAKLPGFPGMLEEALLAQDFHITQLHTPSKYPPLRSHLFRLGECDQLTSDPYTSGDKASIFSILSFEGTPPYEHGNAWGSSRRYHYRPSSSFDAVFTNFWRFNGRAAPGSTAKYKDDAFGRVRGAPLFGLEPTDENGPAAAQPKALTAQLSTRAFPLRAGEGGIQVSCEGTESGFPRYNIDNRQSIECVRILGPSPGSSVVLSHALINGSTNVLDSLLTAMRPLSFDFGHWKLLAWLGKAPPVALYDSIVFGAPFSVDGTLAKKPRSDVYVVSARRQATKTDKDMALVQAEPERVKPAGQKEQEQDEEDVSPKFNAMRDWRNQTEQLAAAKTGVMAWAAPFMGSEHYSYGEKKSDAQIEVCIQNSICHKKLYLTEAEIKRRVESIHQWNAHIEGLLNLARKLYTLERYVARTRKKTQANILKTEFVRFLEKKPIYPSLGMLKSVEETLRKALREFKQRAAAEASKAVLTAELAELAAEFKEHDEEMPPAREGGPYPRNLKRQCTGKAKGGRKSKRVRSAEDDKYDEVEDEDFDPEQWSSDGEEDDDEEEDEGGIVDIGDSDGVDGDAAVLGRDGEDDDDDSDDSDLYDDGDDDDDEDFIVGSMAPGPSRGRKTVTASRRGRSRRATSSSSRTLVVTAGISEASRPADEATTNKSGDDDVSPPAS